MASLSSKNALVTGSTSGIGLAIARAFAAEGANVTINGLGDAADIERERAGIEKDFGVKCRYSDANMMDGAAVTAMIHDAEAAFGSLDILVNNAGIAQARKLLDISDDDWDATLDINLRGMLNMAQAAIPRMEDGGAIICLASIAAQRGGGLLGGPHYAASKGGVLALAKSMARELGPRNIRVNCVNPGIIITQMNATAFDEATQRRFLEGIPLGRFGAPKDVANVCLFLASPLSGYITGSAIDINGGMHIH